MDPIVVGSMLGSHLNEKGRNTGAILGWWYSYTLLPGTFFSWLCGLGVSYYKSGCRP